MSAVNGVLTTFKYAAPLLLRNHPVFWEEVASTVAFLLNIPTRYEFETRFYDARAERPLLPDELKTLMSEAWTKWHGDALSEPDPLFWVNKLHFYISKLSFYNFPYLLGIISNSHNGPDYSGMKSKGRVKAFRACLTDRTGISIASS